MRKTKIILDADIVIHFAKAGWLNKLPSIFPGYEYIILDTVYKEILKPTRIQLDNQIQFLRNITKISFSPTGDMLKEYALLSSKFGKGESACMAYCKYNNDVIGSSNLRDIKEYCHNNNLTYITTLDFLYYAINNKIMTRSEAKQFVIDVTQADSKLPYVDFDTFVSKVIL